VAGRGGDGYEITCGAANIGDMSGALNHFYDGI
jgi:hypothetical protein